MAQVILSSFLPVVSDDIGRNRWTQSINIGLRGWCHQHRSGFSDSWMAYTALGLLASDEIQLSQRGKRLLFQELVGLMDRALN